MARPKPSKPDQNDPRALYMKLAQLSHDSFDRRRTYEWKVGFSLWGAIAALVYAALTSTLTVDPPVFIVVLVGIVIALCFWLFLVSISEAHTVDKIWKHYYLKKAEGEDVKPPDTKGMGPSSKQWIVAQMGFTVALIVLAATLLLSR